MIGMSGWGFTVGGGHPALVAIGHAPPQRPLAFATHLDLLAHMAANDDPPRSQLDSRLEREADVLAWRKVYTRLKNAPHFRSYRGRAYERYRLGSIAVANGSASARQAAWVAGLQAEIAASRVIVPAGQIVFHGRADQDLTAAQPYAAFVSTTINPIVARKSAMRRALQGGRQMIYALTLTRDLPALWGHVGNSGEWELLLSAGLTFAALATHPGRDFDVVEASVI